MADPEIFLFHPYIYCNNFLDYYPMYFYAFLL